MEIEKLIKVAVLTILSLSSLYFLASKNILFSLEIQGGIKTVISQKEEWNITKTLEVIQKRISLLNLPEHKVSLTNDKIEILSLNNESLGKLLEKGKFEAKILRRIVLTNFTGNFLLENSYPVRVEEKIFYINDEGYKEGERFYLENIEFKILNVSNETVFVEGFFFGNEDVKTVYTQISYLTYNPDFKSYEFRIPVDISKEASLRFETLTKNAGRRFLPGGFVLDASLIYYLNEKPVSEIPLPVQMGGSRIESITILGYDSKIYAKEKMEKIMLALQTGMLPELRIEKYEYVEPKFKNFIDISLAIIALILTFNSFLFMKRYGKKYLLVPCLLAYEIFIVLGIAGLSQKFLRPGWVFDTYSFIGLFLFLIISSLIYFLETEKIVKNKKHEFVVKFKRVGEVKNLIKIFFLTISFILLFTQFKGFGLSIIVGIALNFLTNSIYVEMIKTKSLHQF